MTTIQGLEAFSKIFEEMENQPEWANAWSAVWGRLDTCLLEPQANFEAAVERLEAAVHGTATRDQVTDDHRYWIGLKLDSVSLDPREYPDAFRPLIVRVRAALTSILSK